MDLSRQRLIQYIPFLTVVIFGLIPLTWFRGHILLADEEFYAINYSAWMQQFLFVWGYKVNAGFAHPLSSFIFPQGMLFYFFEKGGITTQLAQKLWHILLWESAGIGMYMYIKSIYGKYLSGSVIASIGANFYLLAPFAVTFSPLLSAPRIVFALLPWIALNLWKAKNSEHALRYAVMVVILIALSTSAHVNLPAASVIYIFILWHFLFSLFTSRHRVRVVFFYALLGALIILIHFWWISVFVSSVDIGLIKTHATNSSMEFLYSNTKISDTFRTMASWAFRLGHDSTKYFSYSDNYYTNGLVVVASYIPILIIVLTYVLKNKTFIRSGSLWFFGTFLLIVFISKGALMPYGEVYTFLFDYVAGFWIYREPFIKFMVLGVFFLSVLLSMSLVSLLQYKKRIVTILFSIVGVSIIIAGYPLITGDVLRDKEKYSHRANFVEIPPYWKDVYKEDFSNVRGRILLTPPAQFSTPHEWVYGYTGNPATLFLNHEIVNWNSGYDYTSAQVLIDQLYQNINNREVFLRLSGMLSISHILQQNTLDFTQTPFPNLSPIIMEDILHNLPTHIVSSFGNHSLDFYAINIKENPFYVPKIYIPKRVIINNNVQNNIINIVSQFSYMPQSVIVSQADADNFDIFDNIDMVPTIQFTQEKPILYKVKIYGARRNFLLVLGESFHNGWVAYESKNNGRIFENHLMANGYANSWVIDTDSLCHSERSEGSQDSSPVAQNDNVFCIQNPDGSYDMELVIEFWPQRLFYVGLGISGATLFGCLVYLAYDFAKRRKMPVSIEKIEQEK